MSLARASAPTSSAAPVDGLPALMGVLLGWVGVTTAWGVVFGGSLVRLNDLSSGDGVALAIFWSLLYLPVLLPGAVLAAVIVLLRRAAGVGLGTGARVGSACTAAVLLAVVLFFRWVPTYKAATDVATPMGLLGLGVIVLALVVFGLGALWLTGSPPGSADRLRGAIAIGAAASLAVVGHLANRVYEVPSRIDLVSEVLPQLESDASCSPSARPVKGAVLLGLDGMTWNILSPMMKEGKLPEIRRLLARSSFGHLDTLAASYSPVVWATIASGLSQGDHRIDGFMRFRFPGIESPISRGPLLNAFMWWGGANRLLDVAVRLDLVESEPLPSHQRQGQTLWHVAAAHGHSVGIFDWMNIWPVEAVDGYMVTEMGTPPLSAWPVQAATRSYATGGGFHSKYAGRYEHAMALYEQFHPSFSMHFNKVMDDAHDHWVEDGRHFVSPSTPTPARIAPDIERAYELSDEWIGRFADALPDDHVLAIVSDHGYEFNGTHHAISPPGVVILSGGPFACGQVIEGHDVYDVAPTLLAVLGLPGLEAMPGGVMEAAFAGSPIPELSRLVEYPAEWRGSVVSTEGGEGEESWDDLRDNLKALGYVN